MPGDRINQGSFDRPSPTASELRELNEFDTQTYGRCRLDSMQRHSFLNDRRNGAARQLAFSAPHLSDSDSGVAYDLVAVISWSYIPSGGWKTIHSMNIQTVKIQFIT